MSEEASHTFSEVLDQIIQHEVEKVKLGCPARVETYDEKTQTASVQPLLKRRYIDDTGEHIEQLPIISMVPVMFPGTGAFYMVWGVGPGDTVWLSFSFQSLDRWLVRGGVVDPFFKPGRGDAVAHVGLRSTPEAIVGAPTRASGVMVISAPTEVRIGGTSPLVTRDEFLNHSHAIAGSLGTPSPPVPSAAPGSSLTFPGTPKLRG